MLRHICICMLPLAAAFAADEPKPAGLLPATAVGKADKAPAIDGVLDEPAWKTATVADAGWVWGKVGVKSDKPRMIARFLWDDDYLYIGYEVNDDTPVSLGSGKLEGPAGNQRESVVIGKAGAKPDVVEFFVSFGDKRVFWELHHNAANHFSDILCIVADDDWPIAKTAVFRFGIHFGTGETVDDDLDAGKTLARAAKPRADGSGYTGELRLPWHGLGAPLSRESWLTADPTAPGGPKRRFHGPWKMAGQEILILSVAQDGDSKELYHHSSPTKPGGWFHKGVEHWPKYVLAAPAK